MNAQKRDSIFKNQQSPNVETKVQAPAGDKSLSKVRRIKFESPENSVLSNASERDVFSKSLLEGKNIQKRKSSVESEDESDLLSKDGENKSDSLNDKKRASVASGPKIYVTPADQFKSKGTHNTMATLVNMNTMKEKPTLKEKVNRFFNWRERKPTINLVGDQIKKKQMLEVKKSNAVKMNSGRLLQIISEQAISGRNADVSKAFRTALTRVNPQALQKAQTETIKKKKKAQNMIRGLKKSFKNMLGPYKPDSTFISLWKVLLLTSILIQSFLSTFTLVFDYRQNKITSTLNLIDISVDIVYIVSIAIRFRTAYYHHGELRTKPSDIVKNYLRGAFIFDALSELSLIGRLTSDDILGYLLLFTLIRIYQIPSLIAAMEDFFQFSRQTKSLEEVLKLVMVVFMFGHWFACILYAFVSLERPGDNWLVGLVGVEEGDVVDNYVVSLYWSLMLMTTVGFGDVLPRTTAERVLVIAIMMISNVIFGFLLSSIGSLLMQMSAYSSEAREKIRLLNKYMNEKGLSKDIQSKIRKYLEFYLDRENRLRAEGDSIIQLLSQNLKDEIIKEVNAKILNDIYMFSFNFRKKFLYLVSKDFVERSFGPDEVIFRHGDNNDCSVYFIISGKVEIYYEKSDLSLQKIEKGKSFGFLSFFSGQPRTASARSLEFTTVFILNAEKFFPKLEEFHTEKEMYTMIKDSINLYQSYQYLNIRCYSCGSREHIAINCPKVHPRFNKQRVISKFTLQEKKFREGFKRKMRLKYQTLRDLEMIQEAAAQHQVIQQNELYFEQKEGDTGVSEVRSYSSIDDIMDRNIYETPPLVYADETTPFKTFNINDMDTNSQSFITQNISPPAKALKKKGKNKMGEIEAFVAGNYDRYYHNLNLDRVKNFEVYNPNNNIIKIMVDLEKARLQRIVEMRLGSGGHVISRLLVKGFRMAERRKKTDVSQSSVGSAKSVRSARSGKSEVIERKLFHQQQQQHQQQQKHRLPQIPHVQQFYHNAMSPDNRRQSVSVNPSDIALYSTGNRNMFGKAHRNTVSVQDSSTSPGHLKIPRLKNMPEPIPSISLNIKNEPQKKVRPNSYAPISEEKSSLDDHMLSSKRNVLEAHFQRNRKRSVSSQGSDLSIHDINQNKDGSMIQTNHSIPSQTRSVHLYSHKRPTAQFGESYRNSTIATTRHAFNPLLPSAILRNKHRQSYPVNIYQADTSKKAVLFVDSKATLPDYNEDSSQRKPIAMFDFTQLVKKMSGKLEENSRSPLSNTHTSLSISSKATPVNNYKRRTEKPPKSLFVEILHQNSRRFPKRKKGRSNSQGNGEEVHQIINKYKLDEIMKTHS